MKPSSVGASYAYAKVVKYSRSVLSSDASYLRKKRCEVVHEEEEEEDIDTSSGNAVNGGGGNGIGGVIHKDKFTKTAAVMVS